MRCDQCRHWKPGAECEGWSQRWTGQGTCMAVIERWRVREGATQGKSYEEFVDEGDWDSWDDSPPPEGGYTWFQLQALKEAKATVQDGSDYHAELITEPCYAVSALRVSIGARRK